MDFRKLSRSGRPKYSSGGHAALNAAASSGCSPYSTSAAAAHASLPSTSNGAPAAAQQTSQPRFVRSFVYAEMKLEMGVLYVEIYLCSFLTGEVYQARLLTAKMSAIARISTP